jgi:hypothetical protein
MELNLVDPFDSSRTYNPLDTVVVGIEDYKKRAEAIAVLSQTAHVFDLYRNPELLLPMITSISCFFRILDANTYFAVEEAIIADVESRDNPTPTVVYDLGENLLYESPYVINGDRTLPEMVKVFFDHCRSNRR